MKIPTAHHILKILKLTKKERVLKATRGKQQSYIKNYPRAISNYSRKFEKTLKLCTTSSERLQMPT